MTNFQRARSEEQRQVRRRVILDTAAAMLDEVGVAAVSLNELSRRVGLAKSNVLRYFESREAILLELLAAAWSEWNVDLPEQLRVGISPRVDPGQRGEQLADILSQSLIGRGILCDLLSAQAGVLEQNISPQVAARYKHEASDNVSELASLVRAHLPEVGERAEAFCAQAIMVIGAIWTHSRPSPSMLEAYAADPVLAGMRMDFVPTLRETLATLIAGTLARRDVTDTGRRPTASGTAAT
ncbi:TetR family transcriptional regulator [Rhodococcus sp. NPDC057529]|uniref:TetR/AcrR family transcriptional regulator n=1 Tax=Rhodococcus sp. NPDC057529 TaxID=3346158 RepID=UPI003671FF95